MEFDGATFVVAPQCPDHLWQGVDERAVHGDGTLAESPQARVGLDVGQAFAEFLDDAGEKLRVKKTGGLRETAQAETRQPQALAQRRNVTGLLQAAHAVENGREEVDQKPRAELVVVEFALGVGAVAVQRSQEIHNAGEHVPALHVAVVYLGLGPATARQWRRLVHRGHHARD